MVANLTTRLGQLTSTPAGGPYVGKNRIINGNMAIDQYLSGGTIVPSTAGGYTYIIDRWVTLISTASKVTFGQNYGAVTPPAGFSNYLGAKVTTTITLAAGDYSLIGQKIEGFNVADLNWGSANAKSVTLSFWAYSSATGSFGGAVRNSATNRSYAFTYSIPVANTWTYSTVTIPGDTSGTWLTTTGIGIELMFPLGMGATYSTTANVWTAGNFASATGAVNLLGTLNATLYITGVQLEAGTIATPYEFNQYQVQLAQCQRYYQTYFDAPLCGVISGVSTAGRCNMVLPVVMRTTPTAVMASPSYVFDGDTAGGQTSISVAYLNSSGIEFDLSLTLSTYIKGRAAIVYRALNGVLNISAEL